MNDIKNTDGLGQLALGIIADTSRDNEDAGLTHLLHRMASKLGICWKGNNYPDLAAVASALVVEEKDAISLLTSGVLSHPDILAGDNVEDIRVGLADVAQHAGKETTAEAARWVGAFLLGHVSETLLSTPDDYFQQITRGGGDPAERLLRCVEDTRQLAWLRVHAGCDIWKLLDNNVGSDKERLIRIYQFFESYCQKPEIVREHYIRKGPNGHLAWLRDNLNLYTFSGKEANAIKESICSHKLSYTQPIADLEQVFLLLDGELTGFLKLFQGNLLLAHLGYTCGKPIISKDVNAYFIRQRMGVDVPLGFMSSLL